MNEVTVNLNIRIDFDEFGEVTVRSCSGNGFWLQREPHEILGVYDSWQAALEDINGEIDMAVADAHMYASEEQE